MDARAKSEQVRDSSTKNDQLIRETFQKLAQVILQARIAFPVTSPHNKRINKWFNLEIEELDSIMNDMLPWQGNLVQAPLFLEVYFSSPEPLPHPDYSPLLERWKIVYQPSVGTTSIEFPTVYKHLVLLVRGVAGLLRVMPAFKAYSNCQRTKSGGMSNGGAEIRYSFHSSFPSSREFSPSRPTADFMFDPVISPFGSLTVSVVYRTDCSVEIGATDPIIKAHFIKDYSPSEYTLSTSPPKKSYPHEVSPNRSAPIGIPGKDTTLDTMMPMVSSPPSSLTMMSPSHFTEPTGAPFTHHTPPSSNAPFRQNSLPSQYQFTQHPTSTSPVGIPSATNRFSQPAFSSSPNASGFDHASTGSTFSHTPHTFNSSSTSTNSTSTSNSSSSTGNSNTNITVNTSGKIRPRAASYAPPSTVIPASTSPLSSTPPYSHSVYPRLPYSTSPSKDPYSTSPTVYSPSPTSSSPLTSTSPPFTLRPATNMYMSTLLGPSIHLHSPPLNTHEIHAVPDTFDELAFAGDILHTNRLHELGGTNEKNIEMGEIGEFVRMCKIASPLKMFNSSNEKRIVGSSFLFADMTTSQIKNQLSYFALSDSH